MSHTLDPRTPSDLREGTVLPTLRTTAALAVSALLLTSQLYLLVPAFGLLRESFGVSTPAASWGTSAFGFAYAAGFLLVGPVVSRAGTARVVAGSLLVVAVFSGAAALAPTWPLFLAARAGQGLGASAFVPAALVLCATRLDPRHRAVATSVVISTSFSAGLLGQIATQTLDPYLGFRGVLAVWAALLAAAAATVLLTVRDHPGDRTPVTSLAAGYSALPRTVVDLRLLPLLLASTTVLGSFVLVYTGVALHRPPLVGAHEMILLRASALPAMAMAPFVVSATAATAAVRRIVAALLVGAAGLVVVSLTDSVVVMAAGLFVLVGALAVVAPVLVTEIGGRAGTARPVATALYSFFLFGGASLAPPIASALPTDTLVPASLGGAVALLAAAGVAGAFGRRSGSEVSGPAG